MPELQPIGLPPAGGPPILSQREQEGASFPQEFLRELIEGIVPGRGNRRSQRDQLMVDMGVKMMIGQIKSLSEIRDPAELKKELAGINGTWEKTLASFDVGVPKGMMKLFPDSRVNQMMRRLEDGKSVTAEASKLLVNFYKDIFDTGEDIGKAYGKLQDAFDKNPVLTDHPEQLTTILQLGERAALAEADREHRKIVSEERNMTLAMSHVNGHLSTLIAQVPRVGQLYAQFLPSIDAAADRTMMKDFGAAEGAAGPVDLVAQVGSMLGINTGDEEGKTKVRNFVQAYRRQLSNMYRRRFDNTVGDQLGTLISRFDVQADLALFPLDAFGPEGATLRTTWENRLKVDTEALENNFEQRRIDSAEHFVQGIMSIARTGVWDSLQGDVFEHADAAGGVGPVYSEMTNEELKDIDDSDGFDALLQAPIPGTNTSYAEIMMTGDRINDVGIDFVIATGATDPASIADPVLMTRIHSIRNSANMSQMVDALTDLSDGNPADVNQLLNDVAGGGVNLGFSRALQAGTAVGADEVTELPDRDFVAGVKTFGVEVGKDVAGVATAIGGAAVETVKRLPTPEAGGQGAGLALPPLTEKQVSDRAFMKAQTARKVAQRKTDMTINEVRDDIKKSGVVTSLKEHLRARETFGHSSAAPGFQELMVDFEEGVEAIMPSPAQYDKQIEGLPADISPDEMYDQNLERDLPKIGMDFRALSQEEEDQMVGGMEAVLASSKVPGQTGGEFQRAGETAIRESEGNQALARLRKTRPSRQAETGQATPTRISGLTPLSTSVDESFSPEFSEIAAIPFSPRPIGELVSEGLQVINPFKQIGT